MPKIPIYDTRMLLLMRHCIDAGQCINQKDFLEGIGFNYSNISHLKTGKQGFTIDHMLMACRKYGISMDWICGLKKEMKRVPSKKAIQLLKEAVIAVDQELRQK